MKKTVLIVEDDIDIREHVKMALELEDYQTLTVGNGLEALKVLNDSKAEDLPFCMLVDITMPLMNGIDFLDKLRAATDPKLAQIPVIIATAKGSSIDEIDLSKANKVLKKPFDLDELYSTIKLFE